MNDGDIGNIVQNSLKIYELGEELLLSDWMSSSELSAHYMSRYERGGLAIIAFARTERTSTTLHVPPKVFWRTSLL